MRSFVAPLVKLVAFATVTVTATYVLAATIANASFADTVSYRAQFTDVTGLVKGDDVQRLSEILAGRSEPPTKPPT